MPVNTAALKTFAPAMRRQLLEAVGRKLDLLLNSQTPDTLSTYAKQIAELREQEAENREQLLERVAYTWFNRLCALRYLDARGWHPFGCKVLMPAAEGETQPELLKLMRAGSLPAEMKPLTNEVRLHELLDGQVPPAISGADPQGEVYRELVLASSRSYHQLLPELFEGLDDASELLLPDDLLSEGSIAGGFRSAISDADCEDVEIIGWLYQFYISEKKDQVIGKVVKSEDIPAATQLFTPNWIVKYMVQNTIGATWLATYPDSPLKSSMEFYIEPAEQTPEVQSQLAAITPLRLEPEALTLIDPACGSGHILVEAYDLLKEIYLERGYRRRDIPELILTKNLFGLDICPRAAQLSAFSLLMKGREDDRRLLDRGIQLNVLALQDSIGLNLESLAASVDLAAAGVSRADVRMLCELFTHATTFGSLIQVPESLAEKLPAMKQLRESTSVNIFVTEALNRLALLVQQAELLAAHYDAVVANPPYIGGKGMNAQVKAYARANFPSSKSDLFACFIERNLSFSKAFGRLGYMSPQSFMFLSSFERLRDGILGKNTIASLIQPEYNAFWDSAHVTICCYTFRRGHIENYCGTFIRLTDFYGAELQPRKTLEALRNPGCGWLYRAKADDFRKIPGSPLAYWLSSKVLCLFRSCPPMDSIGDAKKGLTTGDNDRFLLRWTEVNWSLSVLGSRGGNARYYPHLKGGDYRKWYGNHEVMLKNSEHDFQAMSENSGFRRDGVKFFYREGVSWSDITSNLFSARVIPRGQFTFNNAAPSAFFKDVQHHWGVLGLANTNVIEGLTKVLNPSVHFNPGNFDDLPLPKGFDLASVADLIKSIVCVSAGDWDAYERSWDFQSLPLLSASTDPNPTLESSYIAWIANNKLAIAEMKRLEEENNRLFIDAYGLQDELTPEVPIEQITLTVNPSYRYGSNLAEDELWNRFRQDTIKEFLSYATGCMMGRYSLDQPDLILADARESQAEQLHAYEDKVGKPIAEVQFKPDLDGIIPVLDGEWFEDDIVARTRDFLEVTFPESTVTENLRFIEESLGKDIRKYFCSEFYKDHLQTYKKRPIYWMVQSPKKGFACLIYLHRYTKDTLNQVLNNYFRPYLQKLEARLAQLGLDQLNDSLPTRERTAARKEAEKITKVLKECEAWEQDALLPLAQQRIELDLDDGVKVNYLKLQDVLAPIPGLAAKED